MTVRVTFNQSLVVSRAPDSGSSPTLLNPSTVDEQYSSGADGLVLSSSSITPPTHVVSGELSVTTTIDLTAAPDPRYPAITQDLTGKKMLSFSVYPASDNAAVITVAPGASPYPWQGTAKGSDIYPGCKAEWEYRPDGTAAPAVRPPAVAAGVKHITFTLGAGDTCKYVMVFGT